MLTFLELYQTMLGFVFFKLYTDAGLVYPPPLDLKKDEGAAGVGAYSLQEATKPALPSKPKAKEVEVDGHKVTTKDVKQAIKSLTSAEIAPTDGDVEMASADPTPAEEEEEFVPHPSTKDTETAASLPTLQSISALPPSLHTALFAPYTFFLSREISRPIFEFLICSFGGRVGWPESSGGGSPISESDESITHVVIDRPPPRKANETPEERERRARRKYVQPQWVVDCINAGKILLEDGYAQGAVLPPHLSPFGEYYEGAYDPAKPLDAQQGAVQESEDEDEDMEADDDAKEDEEGDESAEEEAPEAVALKAAVSAGEDPEALRAAELAAEAAGVDYGAFEKQVAKSQKKAKAPAKGDATEDAEQDMNKMMMSNKQRKLYEKVKHSQKKREAEVRSRVLNFTVRTLTCLPHRKQNSSSASSTLSSKRSSRRSRRRLLRRFCLLRCCLYPSHLSIALSSLFIICSTLVEFM